MPKVFLMTDVVGSTGLWEAHEPVMPAVLARHDDIVHGAVAAAGGRVFKHTGDGMIAAFDDAEPALIAARTAGAGLTAEVVADPWWDQDPDVAARRSGDRARRRLLRSGAQPRRPDQRCRPSRPDRGVRPGVSTPPGRRRASTSVSTSSEISASGSGSGSWTTGSIRRCGRCAPS